MRNLRTVRKHYRQKTTYQRLSNIAVWQSSLDVWAERVPSVNSTFFQAQKWQRKHQFAPKSSAKIHFF